MTMRDVDLLRDLLDTPGGSGMNPDLAAWAEEHGVAAMPEPASRRSAPAASGPCRVCRKRAGHACLECGKTACLDHFLMMYGLCSVCGSDAQKEPTGRDDPEWGTSRGRPEADLDVDWVDD